MALDLLNTTVIAAGAGIVLAILAGRRSSLWKAGGLAPLEASWTAHPGPWTAAIALLAFAGYGVIAQAVLSGRPLLIDEIVQVFQARLLAGGELWIPAAPEPEFFSVLHVVEQDGRVYGQFPVGGPAMLALGSLIGAEWLVGPAFGAGSVAVFAALVRRVERPLVALGATLLFALAPFAAFMFGSHMNHATALFWILVGILGLVRAGESGRAGHGIICGLGFGIAAAIRPLDGLAFALPAALWLGRDALRHRRLAPLAGAGLGIVLPLLALGWANARTTGSPFQFGYSVLWGAGHGLGFHRSPWGEVHTPLRGLELVNLYFLRLQTYLFETAIPSLLPAGIALALTRSLSRFDRYLLGAGGLLVGLYFAYWHDGFYLGPRFFFPLLPVLVLWTARAFGAVQERFGSGSVVTRAAAFTLIAALVIGFINGWPNRMTQYRSGMLSLRWDAAKAARQAGISNSLVLVRESWGAELVARLWAVGVSRPDADALYRTIDPCRLDSALAALEASGLRDTAAVARLAPLQADSARLVPALSLTGDPSLRLLAGAEYPYHCVRKLEDNQSGFTLYAPMLLARGGGNVYARDLGPRDSILLRRHPERPVYLLKPESGAVGANPVFRRLDRDSLLASWRGESAP